MSFITSEESFEDIPGYSGIVSYISPQEDIIPTEKIVDDTYPGYQLVKMIGRGVFGTVWKAIRLSDGKTIALKIIRVVSPDSLKELYREVEILKKISSPECQPFLVCFNSYLYLKDRKEFLIDMDLIVGEDLMKYSRIGFTFFLEK